jgi:hypothetical protein
MNTKFIPAARYFIAPTEWEVSEELDYSVEVIPGVGTIYDIHPVPHQWKWWRNEENTAEGPIFRVKVPVKN